MLPDPGPGLELEEGFSPDTIRILKERGHKIKETSDFGVLLVLPTASRTWTAPSFPAVPAGWMAAEVS